MISLSIILYNSLRVNYEEGESRGKCVSILKKIPFVHMYGRLDPLPWEVNGGRIYGQQCTSTQLLEMSKNIKLIHESKKEEIPKRADDLIKNSEKIYFLDFYLRRQENLKLLNFQIYTKKKLLGQHLA